MSCRQVFVTKDDRWTRMFVSFSEDGDFMVCAYSGCLEGRGTVQTTNAFLIIGLEYAPWSFPRHRISRAEDIVIAFDRKDKVAIVKAGEFAHPFLNEASEK